MNNYFTVYSKSGCKHCDRAVAALQLAEQKYVVYNLGVDFDRDEFVTKFGEGSTFPQVSIDGSSIGGANETIKYLQSNSLV
jgi:glutaredoxin 3|tara:strand:+ start:1348 stop:1590 length:243 start_codon:yes stop_codon:yes gene_type:complete